MSDHPKDQLNAALKEAMKAKDSRRRDVIRLLQSAVKQVEIDERRELSPDDVISVLQKEAKKRRESIDELQKAGRAEQAEQEEYEVTVIEDFLPTQMTDEEITKLAQQAIDQVGAQSPKDMGKVMGVLSAQTKGRADGKRVSEIVRALLNKEG